MDLQTARALREAQIKRRGLPPPPPRVRLANELYRPTPTPDECSAMALGVFPTTKIWDGSPLQLDQSWDATPPPTDAPVCSVLPAITPVTDLLPGSQLICTAGTWSLGATSQRQWLRNGSAIVGQTANVYVINPYDVGFRIGCAVVATSAAGAMGSASAAEVGPIVSA
jgi:hypothetical protein